MYCFTVNETVITLSETFLAVFLPHMVRVD